MKYLKIYLLDAYIKNFINRLQVKIPKEKDVYSIVHQMEIDKLESMPRKRRLESLLMEAEVKD